MASGRQAWARCLGTVGFPLIAAALASEATRLVSTSPFPRRALRQATRRSSQLLQLSPRDWMSNPIIFSFEGLRRAINSDDKILQDNGSIASSPAATAAYLMSHFDEEALDYVQASRTEPGLVTTVRPIDLFEIAWSLNYLFPSGAVSADDPNVRRSLNFLEAY